jgi:hypothetical protein
MHQLTTDLITKVDSNLTRLHARCRVATKSAPRARWQTVCAAIATFEAALELVHKFSQSEYEIAVFLDSGDQYGGIMIWSSSEPHVANDFCTFYPDS